MKLTSLISACNFTASVQMVSQSVLVAAIRYEVLMASTCSEVLQLICSVLGTVTLPVLRS